VGGRTCRRGWCVRVALRGTDARRAAVRPLIALVRARSSLARECSRVGLPPPAVVMLPRVRDIAAPCLAHSPLPTAPTFYPPSSLPLLLSPLFTFLLILIQSSLSFIFIFPSLSPPNYHYPTSLPPIYPLFPSPIPFIHIPFSPLISSPLPIIISHLTLLSPPPLTSNLPPLPILLFFPLPSFYFPYPSLSSPHLPFLYSSQLPPSPLTPSSSPPPTHFPYTPSSPPPLSPLPQHTPSYPLSLLPPPLYLFTYNHSPPSPLPPTPLIPPSLPSPSPSPHPFPLLPPIPFFQYNHPFPPSHLPLLSFPFTPSSYYHHPSPPPSSLSLPPLYYH
jgi:hypothetical protein